MGRFDSRRTQATRRQLLGAERRSERTQGHDECFFEYKCVEFVEEVIDGHLRKQPSKWLSDRHRAREVRP
jgi:hypothetical protein